MKDGAYIDVSTLGGGGDTTGLETRLSTVDTVLPQKTEQSALETIHKELLGRLGGKASSQALAVAQHTRRLNIDQNADTSTVTRLQSALQANTDSKADLGLAHSIQAQLKITVKAST